MAKAPEESSLPRRLAEEAEWLPAYGDRPEGMYVRVGGRIGRLTATLRLFGEGLDPDEVTRLLACQPSKACRKGDPITEDGRGSRRVSGWTLDSNAAETGTIDEHVTNLLQRVSQDRSVWQLLACFKPDIFVGVFVTGFNQGGSIGPETAAMLAERGITLQLDIYSHSEGDE